MVWPIGPRLNAETARQERRRRDGGGGGGDDDADGQSGDVVSDGVFVSQRQRLRTVQLEQKQFPEKISIKRGLAIG